MRFSRPFNKEMKWGTAIFGLYLLWGFGWFIYSFFIKGSLWLPYTPELSLRHELMAPGEEGFFLGSDLYGRSLFEVLSAGLVYSLGIGVFVSSLAISIGVVVGYLSVIGPRFLRLSTDMLTNVIFVFPSILIAIMVMSVTGQSIKGLVFALVITGWPGYARIARGETFRVMGLSYVESAKAIGVGNLRLFFKIVIPDILPQMLIHFVLGMSGVIISEAALGFLGLGGSEFSWGALLSDAKLVLLEAPYMTVFLSLSMAGLIIGLNLLGDGLRDYLDPKA